MPGAPPATTIRIVPRVHARVFDPWVPGWAGLAAAAGAMAVVFGTVLGSSVTAWLGFAFFLIAPVFRLRRRPREAELVLDRGGVVGFVFDGWREESLVGRDLVGASTAYLDDGRALLTLQGTRNLTLELADAVAAKAVRDALGVGHHGVGALRFNTLPAAATVSGQVLRVAAVVLAGAAILGSDLAAFSAIVVAMLVLVCTFAARFDHGPRVELFADGVILGGLARTVWYLEIADVAVEGAALVLTLDDGERVVVPGRSRPLGFMEGLGDAELTILCAQIASAMARARGLGPAEPTVAPSIAALASYEDDAAAWLAKVDAMAARLARAGGYRGAPLAEADLWDALENHDAEPEVRAAAARILVHAKPASRARIVEVAEAARDPRTERRICTAILQDPEEAATALTKLVAT